MPRFLLFIFLVSALGLPLSAQIDTYKRLNIQHFTVNQPEVTLRFGALDDNDVKVRTSNDRTYFWYRSNEVLQTQGSFDGRLLHGEYAEFFRNKNLKVKGVFIKGLREGEWRTWYPDGQLKEIKHFKAGRLHGSFEQFDEQGRTQLLSHYKNGLLHGTTRSFQGGKLLKESKYKRGVERIVAAEDKGEAEQAKKERKKLRFWLRESKKNKLEPKESESTSTDGEKEATAAKEKKWRWWPFTRKNKTEASTTEPSND